MASLYPAVRAQSITVLRIRGDGPKAHFAQLSLSPVTRLNTGFSPAR